MQHVEGRRKHHHWQNWEVEPCVEAHIEGSKRIIHTPVFKLRIMVASAVSTRSLHENSAGNMLGSSMNRQGMSLVWEVIFTFSHPISRQLQEKNTVIHCRPAGRERFLHFSDSGFHLSSVDMVSWALQHQDWPKYRSSRGFFLSGFLLAVIDSFP